MVLIGAAGCVSTVNERSTAGVPFLKDKVEAVYPRSLEQVFAAAKEVMMDRGALINEGVLYLNQTNSARAIEGKVEKRKIWIRVEAVEAALTKVIVQARTTGGGSDMQLAAQLDKEIALKLSR